MSHRGFTLIEMLVVIAILTALIGMIMPALVLARENARRITCASNIRQLSQVVQSYSVDHDGKLPELHNSDGRWGDNTNRNPYWYSLKARDWLLESYPALERQFFYCPSNLAGWDRDDFWTWPNNKSSVWGYFYFGAAPFSYNEKTTSFNYSETGGELVFANTLFSKPRYKVIFSDLIRECCGWGFFGPQRRGVNHYGVGKPAGGNEAFLDGHVEWVPWTQMKLRMWSGGNRYYF